MKKSLLLLAATLFAVNVLAQSDSTQITQTTDGTSDSTTILLYPNPFQNLVNVSFVANNDARVNIRLYDAYDKVVKAFDNTEIQAGFNSFQYETDGLPSGVYYMDIIINGVNNVQKIMRM